MGRVRQVLARGALTPAQVAGWVLTRALLVVAPGLIGASYARQLGGDPALYRSWSAGFLAGRLPSGDPRWQYPPGAAVVLAVPRLLGGVDGYHAALVAVMLLADAVILACCAHRPGGAWCWVAAGVCLGPVAYDRFDLAAAACAVGGLAAATRARSGSGRGHRWAAAAGALLAAGTLVKLWPALVLARLRRGQLPAALLAAGAVVAAAAAVLAGFGAFGAAVHTVSAAGGRGLQLEAVAAVPFDLARAAGAGFSLIHRDGAYELTGSGTAAAVVITSVATVLVLAAAVASRRPDPLPGAPAGEPEGLGVPGGQGLLAFGDRAGGQALAAVLAVTLCARVLSPQYLIWSLALAALAGGRRVRLLLLAAALLTQAFYPLGYGALKAAAWPQTLLLTGRDALLVAATVTAVRAACGPLRFPRAHSRRSRQHAN